MFDNDGMENSGMNINTRKEKIPTGTITKGFFNAQNGDDDDYLEQQCHSSAKLNSKKNIFNQLEAQSPKKGSRRSKKNYKLEPLKGEKPKQVLFDDLDDDIGQINLEETKPNNANDNDHKTKQPQLKTMAYKINQQQKPHKPQKNVLYIDSGDDDLQANNIPIVSIPANNNKPKKQSSNNSNDANNNSQELSSQSQNLDIVDNRNQMGVEFSHIKTDHFVNYIIKRDKQWLNKLRPIFYLHSQQNNSYNFSAKMTGNNSTQTFIIGKSKDDFTENGQNYLGKVKSNFVGNQISIYGPGYNPTDAEAKKLPLRQMMATVQYQTNFFGSTKPRNFKVFLLRPNVKYYDLIGTKKFNQQLPLNQLYNLHEPNRKYMLVLVNKKPQWNQEIKGYMLNFGGRVKKASIKNFILHDQNNPESDRMIFGKIDQERFRMDVTTPLSPFVAMGIALSAFGSKIGCE